MDDSRNIENIPGVFESTTSIPKIVSQEDFIKFKQDAGYTRGHHGTFQSDKDRTYLYEKRQYILSSEDEVTQSLKLLNYFKQKGIFHPATKWGTYKTTNGDFQIYTIMPELEVCSNLKAIPEGRQKFIKRAPDQQEHEWYNDLLLREDSHVLEWYRRLDPNFDGTKDVVKGEGNQLTSLLNPFEASHTDNWGWDTETGKLYPVDMEVISLNETPDRIVINNWTNGKPTNELIDHGILDLLDSLYR